MAESLSTEDADVAATVIAWEITRWLMDNHPSQNEMEKREETLETFTEAYKVIRAAQRHNS